MPHDVEWSNVFTLTKSHFRLDGRKCILGGCPVYNALDAFLKYAKIAKTHDGQFSARCEQFLDWLTEPFLANNSFSVCSEYEHIICLHLTQLPCALEYTTCLIESIVDLSEASWIDFAPCRVRTMGIVIQECYKLRHNPRMLLKSMVKLRTTTLESAINAKMETSTYRYFIELAIAAIKEIINEDVAAATGQSLEPVAKRKCPGGYFDTVDMSRSTGVVDMSRTSDITENLPSSKELTPHANMAPVPPPQTTGYVDFGGIRFEIIPTDFAKTCFTLTEDSTGPAQGSINIAGTIFPIRSIDHGKITIGI